MKSCIKCKYFTWNNLSPHDCTHDKSYKKISNKILGDEQVSIEIEQMRRPFGRCGHFAKLFEPNESEGEK